MKIILADDQRVFTESLSICIKNYADDITIEGVAHNGKEAVELAVEKKPDVVVMDLRMPVMDGVEASRIIKERLPAVKIIILSTYQEDALVRAALQAGASGYLLKDIRPQELIVAVRALNSGLMQISPEIVGGLLKEAKEEPDPHEKMAGLLHDLTPREKEISELLIAGYSNEQIGRKLGISFQTVRNQVSTIYSKLNVKDRFEMIQLANEKADG